MTDVDVIAHSGTGAAANITTNNGSANFDPIAVLHKKRGFETGGGALFKTDTMSSANTCFANAVAQNTGSILTLGTGQYSVSSANLVNQSGQTYNATVWGGSSGIATGTYTGDGTDPQGTTVGFDYDQLFVVAESTQTGFFYSTYQDTNGYNAKGLSQTGTQAVLAKTGSGGTAGFDASGGLNTNTTVYHWLAIADVAAIAVDEGYAGNGTDPRTLTLGTMTSVTPESVFGGIVAGGFTGRQSRYWVTGEGDNATTFEASGESSSTIEGAGSGTVTLGTSGSQVNGSSNNYVLFCYVTGTDGEGGGGATLPKGSLSLLGVGI